MLSEDDFDSIVIIPCLIIGVIIAASWGYGWWGIGGAIVVCIPLGGILGYFIAIPVQFVYSLFTDSEERKSCLFIVISLLAIYLIFNVVKGLWGVRF